MKKRFARGVISPTVFMGAAFLGVATIFGFIVIPMVTEPTAEMFIEPAGKTVPLGETFTVELMVRSSVPTNVFAGELRFDNDTLAVSSIDYNTSIADLWAEKPWYENGDGTLNFAGGTTRSGGFIGNDTLLTITFTALQAGDGMLTITDPRILRHDGKGTDVALPRPLDAIFTVTEEESGFENVASAQNTPAPIKVVKTPPTTDLNGDGTQSVVDISIFMLNIGGDDPKYDFNLDGNVNTKDLGIIMRAE